MSMKLADVDTPAGADSATKAKKRKSINREDDPSRKRRKHAAPEEEVAANTSLHKKKRKKSDLEPSESQDAAESVQGSSQVHTLDSPTVINGAQNRPDSPEDAAQADEVLMEDVRTTQPLIGLPSPFHSIRISLYVPLSAISLSSATQSLLSTHLAPLLLTYYPPAQGVVLSFEKPVISTKPAHSPSQSLAPPSEDASMTGLESLALAAEEYGASWVWLTATLMVFRPEKGMEMNGFVNICSEGFIGLVLYNYFQTAIAKSRIPRSWKWNAPGGHQSASRRKRGKKGKIKDYERQGQSQSQDDGSADAMDLDEPDPRTTDDPASEGLSYFLNATGAPVNGDVRFRVVDSEVVPINGREKWSLQVEGSLLESDEEHRVLQEENAMFERINNRNRSLKPGSRRNGDDLMSGSLHSEESSEAQSVAQTPGKRHRVAY